MEKILDMKIKAYYKYIRIIKRATESFLDYFDFMNEDIYMLKLAVSEAAANIIEHSYLKECDGTIEFCIRKSDTEIEFSLIDNGTKFDLENIKSRQLDDYKEGGLGVYIIKTVMDSVEYTHLENGTMLVMKKRIGVDLDEHN